MCCGVREALTMMGREMSQPGSGKGLTKSHLALVLLCYSSPTPAHFFCPPHLSIHTAECLHAGYCICIQRLLLHAQSDIRDRDVLEMKANNKMDTDKCKLFDYLTLLTNVSSLTT